MLCSSGPTHPLLNPASTLRFSIRILYIEIRWIHCRPSSVDPHPPSIGPLEPAFGGIQRVAQLEAAAAAAAVGNAANRDAAVRLSSAEAALAAATGQAAAHAEAAASAQVVFSKLFPTVEKLVHPSFGEQSIIASAGQLRMLYPSGSG